VSLLDAPPSRLLPFAPIRSARAQAGKLAPALGAPKPAKKDITSPEAPSGHWCG
jgi:hypothetical protein